jgi:hypothetical protein
MPVKPEYQYHVDILDIPDPSQTDDLEDRLNQQFGKFSLILTALVPLGQGKYLTIAYTTKSD